MPVQVEFLRAKQWEKEHGSKYLHWKQNDWSDSHEHTIKFLKNLHKPTSNRNNRLYLYPHQFEALQRLIFSYEILGIKDSLANLATGTGKTVVIASVVAWLKCRYFNTNKNFDSFLILCPNTIVRDRLKTDFEDKSVFNDFKMFPKGYEDILEEIKPLTVNPDTNVSDIVSHNLFVANKHQFENSGGKSQNQLLKLKESKRRIAIINDEAHNTRADQFTRTLSFLKIQQDKSIGHSPFRFDLTATPKRADGLRPESHENYELTVLEAINGSYKNNPYINKDFSEYSKLVKQVEVIQTQPEHYLGHNLNDESIFVNNKGQKFTTEEVREMSEADLTENQLMMEPGPMKLQLKASIESLKEKRVIADGRYKPLLYVITPSIAGAREAKKVLKEDFKMNPLVVTGDMESDFGTKEELRVASTKVSDLNSPYDCVINVYMLREGWDEPQVSVICLLRTFKSYLYAHQVIGRGLRLIRNPETKEQYRDEKVQTCTVVDHPALGLDWLWKDFGINLSDIKNLSSTNEFDPPEALDEQLLIRDEIMEALIPPAPVDTIKLDLDEAKSAFQSAFMRLDKMSFDWILTGGKISATKVASSLDSEIALNQVEYSEEDLFSEYDGDIKTALCRRVLNSVNELGRLCFTINRNTDYFYQKAIDDYGLYIFGDKSEITKGDDRKLYKLLHNIDDLDCLLQYFFVSEALNIMNKRKGVANGS